MSLNLSLSTLLARLTRFVPHSFIVINKIDIMRPADLDPARKAMLDAILVEDNVSLLELSCVSDEGVMDGAFPIPCISYAQSTVMTPPPTSPQRRV